MCEHSKYSASILSAWQLVTWWMGQFQCGWILPIEGKTVFEVTYLSLYDEILRGYYTVWETQCYLLCVGLSQHQPHQGVHGDRQDSCVAQPGESLRVSLWRTQPGENSLLRGHFSSVTGSHLLKAGVILISRMFAGPTCEPRKCLDHQKAHTIMPCNDD